MSLRTALLCLCAAAALAGCQHLSRNTAAVPGGPTFDFEFGRSVRTYPLSVGDVWPIVRQVARDQKLEIKTDSVDELSGKLEARDPTLGKDVIFEAEGRPEAVTVKVRVGLLIGHRSDSDRLLTKIHERLAPSVAPIDEAERYREPL